MAIEDVEIPQARATDPMTSKLAKKSQTLGSRILGCLLMQGPATFWELVERLNAERESYIHGDKVPREVTIDSVSSALRPLERKGRVHRDGTKENTVRNTGNEVTIWAFGPSPDWHGEEHTMPIRHTYQRNKPRVVFEAWLVEDLMKISEQARTKAKEDPRMDDRQWFALLLTQDAMRRAEIVTD